MLISPATLLSKKADLSFSEEILQKMGGLTSVYYLDFVNNRAICNSVDVGACANIPSLAGTLALSSRGHLVSSTATGLTLPISGVTYPLTLMLEFERTADSGTVDDIANLFDGTANNFSLWRVNGSDHIRLQITSGAVSQATLGSPTSVTALNTIYKVAARVETNNSVMALLGVLEAADVGVNLPASPTTLELGLGAAVQDYTGYIRKYGIALGAATDAQLQAISSTF